MPLYADNGVFGTSLSDDEPEEYTRRYEDVEEARGPESIRT